ncbi:MAG TPA: histidinol dehydrogenase [Holophagaceae bacterium]|nr:histidinol dehydrogenase [Holophagaceae bacterium]
MFRCYFISPSPLGNDAQRSALLTGLARDADVEENTRRVVADVLSDVRARGLDAVLEATGRYDGFALEAAALRVPQAAMAEALARMDVERPALVAALGDLIAGVRRFARAQRRSLQDLTLPLSLGGTVGERWVPLQSVGVYVPGGRAFYPSTFAMTVIPAQEAGVRRIVAVTPPRAEGVDPLILATAALLGVDELVTLGGAQAIAWLAFGEGVDLIAGPGNRFVAEAKRQLVGTVGIDSVAGPTELLILADAGADPAWLAEDLLAQAEHDPEAAAVLVSADANLLQAVAFELRTRAEASPRRAILEQSLSRFGRLIQADRAQAIAFAQAWAPEHLQLCVTDPETWLPELTTAAAVFLGTASAEAFGDYGVGPNHVLPTLRSARFSSPLGVATCMKRQSLLRLSPADAAAAAPWVAELAQAEGLHHHGASARLRAHSPSTAGN